MDYSYEKPIIDKQNMMNIIGNDVSAKNTTYVRS